ncbi:MAG: GDP-mannose 4,6-dehydratase [Planctomycetes bacterium]|nr:GDP-mannose 4,6-dehydratase [Planctomycetota bacterium]
MKRQRNGNGKPRPNASRSRAPLDPFRPVLITGGAGFVGVNVAAHWARQGQPVMIFDNLSRPGVRRNLDWLTGRYGSLVEVETADIRDERAVRQAVSCACRIYHFAAQVAVTTSFADPASDFEVNARGTFNVLEAARRMADPPPLLFTSTNKVYGNLKQMELVEGETRYTPTDRATRDHGAGEDHPLDFHSPYGCSKGAADQYVLDYARCYNLPAVVFRMSCIYGPHQCGNEDQGWVAHFLLSALRDEPICIYGDGKQVRDVLFVEDLVEAMTAALDQIDATRGRAFNIGGGPENTLSLLELLYLIEDLVGRRPEVRYAPWRKGDQRYYVSDIRTMKSATGWRPRVSPEEGVERLCRWLDANRPAARPAVAAV